MTRAEFIRRLLLLPPFIEIEFITEAGVSDITEAELVDFTALATINRLQGTDAGERPRLLVLLPPGVRSVARVDQELEAAFEEMRRMRELLGEARH